MDEKIEHIKNAKRYVLMALMELKDAKILIFDDPCWLTIINTNKILRNVVEVLSNAIGEQIGEIK